LNYVDLKKLYY